MTELSEPGAPWSPTPPPWPPEVPFPHRPDRPSPDPDPAPQRTTVPMLDPRRWADILAERLHADRMLMVSGVLDDETAHRAVAEIMLLDGESDEPIRLLLSCPDADLDAALLLAESVELAASPVTVVAQGTVGGAAVGVLAAAPRRLAQPHTVLWLREPRASAEGRADEVAQAVRQHERRVDQLRELLTRATGRSVDEVAADLRDGRSLTADEAVATGLVHEIVTRSGEPERT